MINIEKITYVSIFESTKLYYEEGEKFLFWTIVKKGHYVRGKKLGQKEVDNYIPESILRIGTMDGMYHDLSFKSKELAQQFFNKELKNKIKWIYES